MKFFLLAVMAAGMAANSVFAQVSVQGVVKDPEGLPVPFANVALYRSADTSVFKYGTITDLNGNYEVKDVAQDNYILVVSFMGYKNLRENIVIDKVAESLALHKHTLEPDALLLEAATVKDSRVKVQSDKTTYSILSSDIKAAPSALELTTIVPQVKYDPVSEKISSANGMAGLVG